MLSFSPLGVYDEGVCADGADFVCGPRGGVQSCRPCDFPQLEAFKALQNLANSLVVAFGLDASEAIAVAPNSCTGGYLLADDGRIGPCTRRTVRAVIARSRTGAPTVAVPSYFQGRLPGTNQFFARYAVEAADYLNQAVVAMNAPAVVPVDEQPIVYPDEAPPPGEELVVVTPDAPPPPPEPTPEEVTEMPPLVFERKRPNRAARFAAVAAIGAGAGLAMGYIGKMRFPWP
jgi:hypothetical protein